MLKDAFLAVGAALVGAAVMLVLKSAGIPSFLAVPLAYVPLFGLVKGALVALISPVGLVIAAVVALGTVLLVQTDAGAKALAWLGTKFSVLQDDAMRAWQTTRFLEIEIRRANLNHVCKDNDE